MVGVPHLSGSQKIFNALFILACEQGSIVERLENAYRLALAPLDVQLELPESIHAEFLSVRKELERLYFAPNREAARDRSDEQRAMRLAGRLVSLYDRLVRLRADRLDVPDRS